MSVRRILMALCFAFSATSSWAVTITPYAWEFPRITNVSGASDLIQDLQAEVQKILNAGHLAPIYLSYADQASMGFRTYQEPGRIITTLAWAYPYLTPAQQTAVKAYVASELADARFTPWASANLPSMVGTPRELHLKTQWWYDSYSNGSFGYRPRVQTLYGLWLYGYRTGDWTLVQNNWASIKSFYTSRTGEANLYGTMGAHIAMVRMADKFNDTAMRTTALNNLQTQLDAGVNFTTVENNAIRAPTWSSPYSSIPDMYAPRTMDTGYHGWIFLNVTPEIGRYLASENAALTSAVLARHTVGTTALPYWWVERANYFTHEWGGDEGSGLIPDVVGMFAPIERWVVQANAPTLRMQMKSAPTGIGDCYWLEALVQAIEAHGTLSWADVRNQTLDTLPPSAPRGLRFR